VLSLGLGAAPALGSPGADKIALHGEGSRKTHNAVMYTKVTQVMDFARQHQHPLNA
jgi:hypothetical protein